MVTACGWLWFVTNGSDRCQFKVLSILDCFVGSTYTTGGIEHIAAAAGLVCGDLCQFNVMSTLDGGSDRQCWDTVGRQILFDLRFWFVSRDTDFVHGVSF